MEAKQSHMLYIDEHQNTGVVFGNDYIQIAQGYSLQPDGSIYTTLKFSELVEPFDYDHPEKAKVREDMPTVCLHFNKAESIKKIIGNLEDLYIHAKGLELLDQKLEDQDFPVRVHNVLRYAELETVRDLVKMKRADLLKFRNFGKRSLTELDEWLEKNGLQFGMNI